jgi:hypothetical protein
MISSQASSLPDSFTRFPWPRDQGDRVKNCVTKG